MFTIFTLWTILIRAVDVRAIGPEGSVVGFGAINQFVHNLTGVNMTLYNITDWLGLVPVFTATGFAVLGLSQWIRRKQLKLVDYSIFVLGGFYIAVIVIYVLFETVIINYRPVLINGILEASYPSSTTLLVMCVMPTAIMQFNSRIKNTSLKKWIALIISVFIVFMVAGRLISGVHWISDIIGGTILSTGLITMYGFFVGLKKDL